MSSKIDYRIVGDRGQTALHYALFEKDDAKVADLIKTWPVAKDIIKAYPSMELIRQVRHILSFISFVFIIKSY